MALRDAGTASMAYFYFDFRDADKQRLHNLLPSLLVQLSARSDPCHHILSQLHSAHDRGEKQPSDRAMVECLKKMLTVEVQEPTYIIMDALDECPKTSAIPPPREEVLDFVDELVGLQLPNLHICVTSRPEPDIQAVLRPLTAQPVSLHNERQMECKGVVVCLLGNPNLEHLIGFGGRSANWKSYWTASHQVFIIPLRSCPTAWTRRMNGY